MPNNKKHTIKDCQKIAQLKNGECLSTEYKNNKEKLKWKCGDCSYIWDTSYHTVERGKWCPKCSGNQKLTIENCQNLAESRNGKCLSTEYINAHSKLEWQCECGYIWKSVLNNIKNNNQWCPKCGGNKKITIKDCQEYAKLKNGFCLSTECINNKTKLEWQCKCGYIWRASHSNIKQGSWCPKCAGVKKYTIEEMQNIAKLRNGKCLSIKFKNVKTKLEWQCENNHTWKAIPEIIGRGSWCPDCKIPISELICKYVIEQIFNKPFIKVRPDFLKKPKTKFNLEIDLYNKELNIGFEHNGRHHYEDNVYSKTSNLQYTQENDQFKLELCKLNNTKLIIIPELFNKTKVKDLQKFIISECKKQNIQLPNNIPQIKINIDKIIRDWYETSRDNEDQG